jgi:hypothetical protein
MNPRFVLFLLSVCAGVLCTPLTLGAELSRYYLATPQGQPPKSDVGVDFSASDLNVRGLLTTRRIGDTTLVMPQFVSSFMLAPDLKFESRAIFSNLNRGVGMAAQSDAIETRLIARSFLPMLSEIEGTVRRDSAGESRRKLRLNMNDATVTYILAKPITFKANATIEQVATGRLPGTLITGVETALVQNSATDKVFNRLGFKYSTQTGAYEYQRQAAAFSRSWAQNDLFRLGLEYELMHDATNPVNLQSTVRFTWKGLF